MDVRTSPSAPAEKPHHTTYLDGFRVEACPLFKQHQCQQHRPYTCFNWHFANQRRRKPIRRTDGSFNYSPDIYCEKYDENTGICPDGDACIYLHRVSGDVERKYHLRYYKTAQCVHPTDSRGQCVKNGAHCAFAHSSQDLRQPQHDTSDGVYAGCIGDADGRDRTSFVIEDPLWHRQEHVLSCYKTEQCRKPARLCRQGYACPFYHNTKDRRRPPATFKYRSTPCPAAKSVDEWLDPELCEQGDNCGYCHTRTEQQFHPEIYKSTKCNDMLERNKSMICQCLGECNDLREGSESLEHGYCPRAVFCAFAHHDSEMHIQRTPYTYSSQQSPKEQGTPEYRLGSPSALNGSTNGLNGNGSFPSRPQAIPKAYSASRDDLMSSSYPKAPGFERGPLSPGGSNQEQRNRTYSLNIGHLDMARRAAILGGASSWIPDNNLNSQNTLCRSESAFPQGAMEELSLDLAPIDEHAAKPYGDLFNNTPTSPMRIPGASESFHASPLASFGETIFQSNKVLSSPVASSSSVFSAFPAAKHDSVDGSKGDGEKMALVWEEGLKQARQACEAWRADAEHFKRRAEKAENERNRAIFERDQVMKQLEALRVQCGATPVEFQGQTTPTTNSLPNTAPGTNFAIFGPTVDDVWKPLPAPDSPTTGT